MLRSVQFQTQVAEVETLFGRLESVRLVQSSLYLFIRGSLGLPDLSACVKAVAAYHRSQLTDGIPASLHVLKQLLKEVSRFLPEPLLRLWVTCCSPYFRYKDLISPHEFLFLAANAKDRTALISDLPYGQVCTSPKSNGTFPLDDITRNPAHPDLLLETQAAKTLLLDKVCFIGNSEPRPIPPSASHRISLQDFRKEIGHQSHKEEMRRTLEDCQQKLNAAKLGGRLAFEERHGLPVRQSFSRSPRRKASCVAPRTPQADRSTFFAQVHYSAYVPPHLLFPTRPKFTKVLRRKRTVAKPEERSVSIERSGSLKNERARSAVRLRDWLVKCKQP